MNATPEQIRKAFKDMLQGLQGLTVYATAPASPKLPCAFPLPAGWRYGQTFDGSVTWTWRLWFLFPKADLNKTQLAFDSYIAPVGPNSVPARFNPNQDGDPTMGGVVDSASVIGGDQYLGDGPAGDVATMGSFLIIEILS